MVGNVYAWSVEPVVNPSLREAKRQSLIRVTKQQIGIRTGPVRQIDYRDQVVSPLALEAKCRTLLQRVQCAIATIVTSRVYAGDLRGTGRGLSLSVRDVRHVRLKHGSEEEMPGPGPLGRALQST